MERSHLHIAGNFGVVYLSNNAEQGLDNASCADVDGGRSLGFARV